MESIELIFFKENDNAMTHSSNVFITVHSLYL